MPKDEKQINTSDKKTEKEATPVVETVQQPEPTLSPEEIQKRNEAFEQIKTAGEEDDRIELAETRAEIDEHFRREQAREFIAKELPETEERIEQKMDPECQVSVVIPAYGERDYILRPLGSLAEQQGVDPSQFEVIFIINNQSEARDPREKNADYKRRIAKQEQRRIENQETLKLFEAIKSGSNEGIKPEEQEIVDSIRKSGIRFYAIDKASSGKGFPKQEANVGGARHRGVCEAVERFLEIDRNGIIAQTDADTRLPSDYIKSLIDVFEQNPDVIGVRGDCHFEVAEGDAPLPPEYSMLEEMNYLYRRVSREMLFKKQDEQTGEKSEPRVDFAGANMASRAYEAAMAGAVPKIGDNSIGGEDTEFGRRIAEIGRTMRTDIVTYPAERESERTSTGHGLEIIRAKEHFEKGEIFMVDEYARTSFEMGLRGKIVELIKDKNISPETLRPLFTFKGEQVLNDKQIKELASRFGGPSGSPNLEELAKDERIVELRNEMTKNLDKASPKISLLVALDIIRKEFMADPVFAEKYQKAVADYESQLEKEAKKAELGERIIDAIFEKGSAKRLTVEELQGIITANSSDISAEEVSELTQNTDTMEAFCRVVSDSKNKGQALTGFRRTFQINNIPKVAAALRADFVSINAMRDVLESEK